MKKLLAITLGLLMLGATSYAVVTHFTETLPPATTNGCLPIANGYDWSLSCNSPAPSATFGAMTTGAQTITGAVTQTGGTVSLTGPITLSSVTAMAFVPNSFTATGQSRPAVIPSTATYVLLLSTGADILLTALPTISTATTLGGSTAIADGTMLVLTSTMAVLSRFQLQDNGLLSGTLLNLPSNVTTEVVTSSRPAVFIYNLNTNRWTQISPNNGSF